jgi:small GTP-binding protein
MKAKVVVVGAAHTGKSSLVYRYMYGEFTPHTKPSTQPAFFQKKLSYMDRPVTLEIWDTAGQEQYHALSPMFYRDADIGIVVCDLSDSPTFARLKQWVTELRQARGEAITIFVVGNKKDLSSQRTVTLESLATFASSIGSECFETSAKTGENVELLFNAIAKGLTKKSAVGSGPKGLALGKKRGSVRFEQGAPRDANSGCC